MADEDAVVVLGCMVGKCRVTCLFAHAQRFSFVPVKGFRVVIER
jgi:hypothetical protein